MTRRGSTAPLDRRRKESAGWPRWIEQIWGDFIRQHGDLAAGAVAVFGLLSLVPAILLAEWLFVTFVARSPEEAWTLLEPRLQQMLIGSSAGGSDNLLLTTVHSVIRARGAAGIVGTLGLLWTGSRIINIITEALNESWQIERGRSFLKQNFLSVVMLVVLGGIFLVSIGLDAGVSRSVKFASHFVHPSLARSLGPPIAIGLNALTSIALFVTLYKWAPNRYVRWSPALVGGILGGGIWSAFQQVFRFYLAHFSSYNKAYGALGAFVILVLWAYYSAYILILGATVSAVYSERVHGIRGPDATTEPGPKLRRVRGEELAQRCKPTTEIAPDTRSPA